MRKPFLRLKFFARKQQGFSLLEVMIAVVISNVALLGLVAGQLKSLQYANNSYQYTVSLIQANNVVERVFNDICKFSSTTSPQSFSTSYVESTLEPIDNYTLDFDDIDPSTGVFIENFTVYVSWNDERMDENDLNKVAVMASYPTVSAGCSVNG